MLSQEKEGLPVSFENKLNYVRMLTIFGNARVSGICCRHFLTREVLL